LTACAKAYRRLWEGNFERLDAVLEELKRRRSLDAASDRGDGTMKNSGALKVTAQSDREIVMTRVFDAPRSLVFDAYTKPELLKRWLGDGREMGVRGVYREVVRPERLVNTEKFDDAWYPGESLIKATFVEQGGKTTLTATMRYESTEARDAVIKSPMESGVAKSYDKLAELLASGGGARGESGHERDAYALSEVIRRFRL